MLYIYIDKKNKRYYTIDDINKITEDEIIDYRGEITGYLFDTIIELDNTLCCLLSHISLINEEIGIRIGSLINITSCHTLFMNKKLCGFGLCYFSRVY